MKPGQIEEVSEELAANLPVCPRCDYQPIILKRLTGVPPRPQVKVICDNCAGYEEYHNDPWHPSLFEAVNIWSLTAKLLGSQEKENVPNQYYEASTGRTYQWEGSSWWVVNDDQREPCSPPF